MCTAMCNRRDKQLGRCWTKIRQKKSFPRISSFTAIESQSNSAISLICVAQKYPRSRVLIGISLSRHFSYQTLIWVNSKARCCPETTCSFSSKSFSQTGARKIWVWCMAKVSRVTTVLSRMQSWRTTMTCLRRIDRNPWRSSRMMWVRSTLCLILRSRLN